MNDPIHGHTKSGAPITDALIEDLADEAERGFDPDDLGFIKRESAFVLEIREHLLREEEGVFARMRQLFTPEQLIELADRARQV